MSRLAKRPRARHTGFYHGPELSVYLTPALRFALLRMGEHQSPVPPSPSLRLSKHRPSVKKSPNWARKKSPILGMCSDPPRYYNPINRQAGRPLRLPPSQERPGFSVDCPPVVLGPMNRALFVSPSSSRPSLSLSQSSYFWPLGMVAPSRNLEAAPIGE